MKRPRIPDAHATIRLRYTREMTAGELADAQDALNAAADAIAANLDARDVAGVQRLAALEHELVENFKQVATREDVVSGKEAVLAGARAPMPEDLAARIRDVERREEALKEAGYKTPDELLRWEQHISLYQEGLKAREEQLARDRADLERTRALLLSDGRRES